MYQPADPLPQTPTWDDMIRLARHSPIVHQVVTLVERGDISREEALIRLAHAQHEHFRALFDTHCDLVNITAMPYRFVLMPDGTAKEL